MDHVAAHPSTAPDALRSLAASVPTEEDSSPSRARALLGNAHLPPEGTDAVLSAIAVRLALPPPRARVTDGASLDDAVSGWTMLRGPHAQYLSAALPAAPASLAAALCSAAARDNAPEALRWVLRSRAVPAEQRAAALRALSVRRALTVGDVVALSEVAHQRPDLTVDLAPRGIDSWATTLLQAAAKPFAREETPRSVAARLNAALASRSQDEHLTTSVYLAKSGPRATAVVVELARTPAGRRALVQAAIAASGPVDLRARAAAGTAALRSDEAPSPKILEAVTELVRGTGALPATLLQAYLDRPDADVAAVCARTDLHGEHLETLLRGALDGVLDLDARQLAALACAPVCTPAHRRHISRLLPAARAGEALWTQLVDVAARDDHDPAPWAQLPVSATRRQDVSTALRRGIHRALRHQLSAPVADASLIQALLVLPVETMDATIAETFELAAAIVS